MFPVKGACAVLGAAASASYIFGCVSRRTLCEAAPSGKWNSNWDLREPSVQDHQRRRGSLRLPTASRHIWLVRHGQYENDPKLDDRDAVLTKLGREQASLTGMRLKTLGVKFDQIVNSTMTRAKQTADLITQHVSGPREVSELLCEGAPCPPEPPHPNWAPSDSEFFQDSAVIEAGFRKFFHRARVEQKHDSNILLVCHANVIRYMVCRALQLQPEAWCRLTLRHGSITKITIFPDGDVVLTTCGDAGYMPGNKLSA